MKKKYCYYQKVQLTILLVAFVMGSLPFISSAQNPNPFALVEYMKVQPGDDNKYVEVEKNYWKPIHQERINQGNIVGWVLYRVKFTGSNDEYNYLTVTLFENVAKTENPYKGVSFENVHPNKDIDEVMNETGKSRSLVKSNLIRGVAFASPEGTGRPAEFKYIEVNFMKTKPGSGYLNIGRTIWQPIQQEFVNSGTRAGWSLWTAIYPRGAGEDFQSVAVNYYSDISQIGKANFNDAFKKAHPDKNQSETMQKALESRSLVRTELWEVVDMVMPGQ